MIIKKSVSKKCKTCGLHTRVSDEEYAVLQRAVKAEQEHKATLVAQLVANERCKFDQAWLEAREVCELEKLIESVQVQVNYAGREGGEATVNQGIRVVGDKLYSIHCFVSMKGL